VKEKSEEREREREEVEKCEKEQNGKR